MECQEDNDDLLIDLHQRVNGGMLRIKKQEREGGEKKWGLMG